MPSGSAAACAAFRCAASSARDAVNAGLQRAGKLELPAGLQRDRAAADGIDEPDQGAAVLDRVPAQTLAHRLQQGADPARPLIGNRRVARGIERDFLVLGPDAELRAGLAARFQPRDQVPFRFNDLRVDNVAGHTSFPAFGPCERRSAA